MPALVPVSGKAYSCCRATSRQPRAKMENMPPGLADMMRQFMSAMGGAPDNMPPGFAEMLAGSSPMGLPGQRPGGPSGGTAPPTGPIDKEARTRLKRQVATLSDAAVSIKEKVELLHELNDACGFGNLQREFIAANGVAKVVEIATSGWPADGDLGRSSCQYDVVVEVQEDISPIHHPDDFEEAMKSGSRTRKSCHSMRRAAISCLGDMSNYQLQAEAMEKEQFFTSQNMGRMLEHTLKRYRYGQSYQTMYDHPDQGQCMAERLVCICANTTFSLPSLRTFLLQQCAISLARHYVTAKEVAVNRRQAAREAKKADRASMGLPPKQKSAFDPPSDDEEGPDFGPCTGTTVPYQWSRFWSNALQRATPAEMEALLEEGLMAKLRASLEGSLSPVGMAINCLEPHFIRVSRKQAAEARAVAQELEAEAMELRLKGNAAFKEGKWQEAVDHYTAALSANWEDVALWNNRSLAFMKLEQIRPALRDARNALGVEPANTKAWARLGDGYKKLGKLQLAQLAYAQAVELAPGDPQYEERLQETRALVQRPWNIDQIPSMADDYMGFRKWMKLPPLPMKRVGKGKNKRTVPDMDAEQDLIGKVGGSQRSLAANMMKSLVRKARIAVRCGAHKAVQLIRELPLRGSWCISWSDTPLKQKGDGLVCFTISIADQSTGLHVFNGTTVGEPKAKVLLMALREACLQPMGHGDETLKPSRPMDVFVAARCLPYYDILADELAKWGVRTTLETYEEAILTCRDHDTCPDGQNFRGEYREEESDEDPDEP